MMNSKSMQKKRTLVGVEVGFYLQRVSVLSQQARS